MKTLLGGQPFDSWPSPLLYFVLVLAEPARLINPPLYPYVPPLSLTLAASFTSRSLTLVASFVHLRPLSHPVHSHS
jgi:hypothetical protein